VVGDQAITKERLRRLRPLEGRRVTVILRDGCAIENCQLVSIGRRRARSLWLVVERLDMFVSLDDVRDLYEPDGRLFSAA
jgi:hypothetical protein